MDQGLLHLVFENNRQNLIITKERRCLNKRRRNISQFSPKKKPKPFYLRLLRLLLLLVIVVVQQHGVYRRRAVGWARVEGNSGNYTWLAQSSLDDACI